MSWEYFPESNTVIINGEPCTLISMRDHKGPRREIQEWLAICGGWVTTVYAVKGRFFKNLWEAEEYARNW